MFLEYNKDSVFSYINVIVILNTYRNLSIPKKFKNSTFENFLFIIKLISNILTKTHFKMSHMHKNNKEIL